MCEDICAGGSRLIDGFHPDLKFCVDCRDPSTAQNGRSFQAAIGSVWLLTDYWDNRKPFRVDVLTVSSCRAFRRAPVGRGGQVFGTCGECDAELLINVSRSTSREPPRIVKLLRRRQSRRRPRLNGPSQTPRSWRPASRAEFYHAPCSVPVNRACGMLATCDGLCSSRWWLRG